MVAPGLVCGTRGAFLCLCGYSVVGACDGDHREGLADAGVDALAVLGADFAVGEVGRADCHELVVVPMLDDVFDGAGLDTVVVDYFGLAVEAEVVNKQACGSLDFLEAFLVFFHDFPKTAGLDVFHGQLVAI